MKEIGLEILNKISEYGYVAYIVGGYVRDTLLKVESNDIDITTNATPMELKNIFPNIEVVNATYGSVILYYKNYRFDITTFRKDLEYLDNRHPSEVVYVNDLKTDLLRRDFTINTLCIDKDGNLIDLLNAKNDLNKHLIQTVVDSDKSFSDDALRILRAIRFACLLDFELSDEIKASIIKNKHLLKKLSYNRKKNELDKIFCSNKAFDGIKLIKEYNLVKELDLDGIERVKNCSDLIGVWAMINSKKYSFSKSEKELIRKVNLVYKMDNLDYRVLYQYGLYVNVLAGINKGLTKKDILAKYESLPIKAKDEIKIDASEICIILKKKPGNFIGKIYKDLENKILNNELENDNKKLREYLENYQNK